MIRQKVGEGAVITLLMPHLIGLDEKAHPALPWLMNGLTQRLTPIDVRLADGKRPGGEVQYQFNKTKTGWLVTLMNHRGIDKTQTGIARVDRRAHVDVVLRTPFPVKTAREWTTPRNLETQRDGESSLIRIRVPAGEVQVIGVE